MDWGWRGVLALDFRVCLGLVLGCRCIPRPLLWFRLKRLITLRILQKLLHLLLDMRRLNRWIEHPNILPLSRWGIKVLDRDLRLWLQIPLKYILVIRISCGLIFNWFLFLIMVSANGVRVLVCLLENCWVSFLLKVVLLSNNGVSCMAWPWLRFILFVYVYCYNVDLLWWRLL